MSATMRSAGLVALLLACGGGSTRQAVPEGFFAEVAVGPGGSIAVDGLALDLRGAVLRLLDDGIVATLDGEADLARHLRPGMVVSMRGEVRGGTVSVAEIVHRSLARGPLAGRGESSLVVAGTEALLGAATPVLDAAGAPVAPEGLAGGTLLEVNGWPEGGARVRASGARVVGGSPAIRLRGWSLSVPIAGVFQLALLPGGEGVLAVDGSELVPLPQVPASALVRVDGSAIAAGRLTSTAIAVESAAAPAPGELAVIEGVATEIGEGELVMGTHRVQLVDGVVFEGVPSGGSPAAALWPGVRLVARGKASAAGLSAERVRLVGVSRVAGRIFSFVTNLPRTTGAFLIDGANVSLLPHTLITDAAGAKLSIAELLDLHGAEPAGLPVVVHGDAELDGTVRAYRVQVTPG